MNYRIEGEELLPKAIIADLDMTLADCRHRLHFIEPSLTCEKEYTGFPSPYEPEWITKDGETWKPDWEAFYEAMDKDGVNQQIAEILVRFGCPNDFSLMNPSEMEVLLVTGRPEKYRYTTERWLGLNNVEYSKLFMRPDFLACPCGSPDYCSQECAQRKPDHRPAPEVKWEIYEREIMGKYDVLFALDDDEDCCQLYRSLGITTLKVMA